MTLNEFLAGAWTWRQLVADLLPVMCLAVVSFWSGYQRGWVVGFTQRDDIAWEAERARTAALERLP